MSKYKNFSELSKAVTASAEVADDTITVLQDQEARIGRLNRVLAATLRKSGAGMYKDMDDEALLDGAAEGALPEGDMMGGDDMGMEDPMGDDMGGEADPLEAIIEQIMALPPEAIAELQAVLGEMAAPEGEPAGDDMGMEDPMGEPAPEGDMGEDLEEGAPDDMAKMRKSMAAMQAKIDALESKGGRVSTAAATTSGKKNLKKNAAATKEVTYEGFSALTNNALNLVRADLKSQDSILRGNYDFPASEVAGRIEGAIIKDDPMGTLKGEIETLESLGVKGAADFRKNNF